MLAMVGPSTVPPPSPPLGGGRKRGAEAQAIHRSRGGAHHENQPIVDGRGRPIANLLPFNPNPTGYFAFLGRISPEKRPDLAIEIAVRAGARLKLAAKIDRADEAYWKDVIKSLVDSSPNVEFVGEIGERDKGEFLGHADALIFQLIGRNHSDLS